MLRESRGASNDGCIMRTPFRLPASGALCGLLLAFLHTPPATAQSLERGVLEEINFARTRPQAYAEALRREAAELAGRHGYLSYAHIDPDAFAEALDFLARQTPLPPLRLDARLSAAALDHALAQGASGQIGHAGPGGEGLGQRLQRHGVGAGLMAENISYGFADPRAVVAQLVIDSGVAGRGHRRNIFGHGYQAAGVGCGTHRVYTAMCVIDFAGAMAAR